MKKIDWAKNLQVAKLEDNNTPFMELDIVMIDINNVPLNANARLYWTGKGMYGQQIQTVLRVGGESFGEKTTGCGYSKKSHALTSLFEHLKISPSKWHSNSDNLFDYHVGGNYYRITE
jgi:hypothetical protein